MAEEIQDLKKEINEVLIREEIMWNQRSKALRLKCEDRNTKFFHATASQRQRKNKIEGLWGSDGLWHDDLRKIEEIILNYFSTIYSTEQRGSYEASMDVVNQRVSREMNSQLLEEFIVHEVKKALQQMHPTKSLGPDGMSPIFYQRY
ncbi:hypothetical protein ACB092_12G012200 [Castanea dentata]